MIEMAVQHEIFLKPIEAETLPKLSPLPEDSRQAIVLPVEPWAAKGGGPAPESESVDLAASLRTTVPGLHRAWNRRSRPSREPSVDQGARSGRTIPPPRPANGYNRRMRGPQSLAEAGREGHSCGAGPVNNARTTSYE